MDIQIIKRAQEILDATPIDERRTLDEWFTHGAFECNVAGAEYVFGVPDDSASVCVYAEREHSAMGEPLDIAIIEPVRINEVQRQSLASYIADYINEEKARGNTAVDDYMVSSAIDAYMGGAR